MSARDELVLDAVAGRPVSRSGWVRGNCPFCEMRMGTPDRKGCLGLEVETGDWHCFRCNARGLVQGVDLEDLDVRPARAPVVKGPIALPEGFFELYDDAGKLAWYADGARDYLARRSVGEQTGRSARVGAVLSGKYRGRIVVPVHAPDGQTLVGWSARLFVDAKPSRSGWVPPKYLYPSGMDRQSTLYNAAALTAATPDPVFIVEGVFDALPLWPDAVACLGGLSPGQLPALYACQRPLVALLDGDAWRKSEALLGHLRIEGKRCTWHQLPPKTDPGASDPGALRRIAAQALREVA